MLGCKKRAVAKRGTPFFFSPMAFSLDARRQKFHHGSFRLRDPVGRYRSNASFMLSQPGALSLMAAAPCAVLTYSNACVVGAGVL